MLDMVDMLDTSGAAGVSPVEHALPVARHGRQSRTRARISLFCFVPKEWKGRAVVTEVANVVNGKHLALLLNCKPSYIVELKKLGRVVVTEDGKGYLAAESVALFEATRDPSRAGVTARHAAKRAAAAPTTTPDDADGDDEPPEPPTGDAKRKAKALADKAEWDARVAERDYLISAGKLLDAGEVDRALAAAGTTLRTALERMVDVMAPQLAAQSDEAKCRSLLWDEVAHALEDISRTFRNVAKVEGA
jgi:hypothetical protein